MPPAYISMDYAFGKESATHFLRHSESMHQLWRRAALHVEQLQNGAWRGRGAEAFYSVMENDVLPALDRLAKALAESSRAMMLITARFQAAEQEAGALFVDTQPAAQAQASRDRSDAVLQCKPPENANERRIVALQPAILKAAAEFNVSPRLIAAIIYDELKEMDFLDHMQNMLAVLQLTQDERSLGIAQMQVRTVYDLVEKGYIPKPDGWESNRQAAAIALLLNEQTASMLVAARVRQTIDHWEAQGVDISQRPEILATLYSIGLEGERGVNTTPESNERGDAIRANMRRMGELLGTND